MVSDKFSFARNKRLHHRIQVHYRIQSLSRTFDVTVDENRSNLIMILINTCDTSCELCTHQQSHENSIFYYIRSVPRVPLSKIPFSSYAFFVLTRVKSRTKENFLHKRFDVVTQPLRNLDTLLWLSTKFHDLSSNQRPLRLKKNLQS